MLKSKACATTAWLRNGNFIVSQLTATFGKAMVDPKSEVRAREMKGEFLLVIVV